jgi:DtxR family Mn-dependent transcriptional regulator
MKLSESEEEYLGAIYRAQKETGEVRVSQVASQLGVKAPSVVQMFRRLVAKGLVSRTERGIRLTEAGMREGARVVRRHRLAERLLADVFGCDLREVHEKACRLEHAIDDNMAKRIGKILKNPPTCPHGGPIPGANGREPGPPTVPLSEMREGERAVVVRIPEDRPTVQRLLSLRILPGTEVRVVRRCPWRTVAVEAGGQPVALSRSIAEGIRVASPAAWRRWRCRWRRGRGRP